MTKTDRHPSAQTAADLPSLFHSPQHSTHQRRPQSQPHISSHSYPVTSFFDLLYLRVSPECKMVRIRNSRSTRLVRNKERFEVGRWSRCRLDRGQDDRVQQARRYKFCIFSRWEEKYEWQRNVDAPEMTRSGAVSGLAATKRSYTSKAWCDRTGAIHHQTWWYRSVQFSPNQELTFSPA